MFGLMKAKTCRLDEAAKLRRRLHYCGTCKTIGRMYGQRSRFLLNNDTVFLAEILSVLSGESERVRSWARAYQSYNCFALPGCEDDAPLPLKFAATATLVLTEFKVKDHASDSSGRAARLAERFYSKQFRDASSLLRSWAFPLEQLRHSLESQSGREATVVNGGLPGLAEDALGYLAEPTAFATALFFEHGARMLGRDDISGRSYEIGFAFGKLVYLLDALEDYEKDFRKGEFNAIKEAFALSSERLDRARREAVGSLLWRLEEEVRGGFFELGIPEGYSNLFASRLRSNLSSRLASRLPVVQAQRVCACSISERASLRERFRFAISLARSISESSHGSAGQPVLSMLAAPFLFAAAVVIGLIFPNQAKETTSYGECIGLLFNLMVVTSFVRSVLSAPLRFAFPPGSAPPGPPPPPPGPPHHAPRGSDYGQLPPSVPPPGAPGPGRRGCSVCCCDADCCDCIDCGECCCDVGDCCSCCDCG